MKTSRSSIFPAIVAVSAVVALAVTGCGKKSESGTQENETDTASPLPRVPVAVHVLESGTAEASVRVWGTVRPFQKAEILSELSGRVAAVHVALGDAVNKGVILLEIDPQLYIARAREAESKLSSARVGHERLTKDLSRMEALFERGTVSDSELEVARSKAAEAEAGYASANASLEAARKELAGAQLRAPFGGHVASRPPDVGSTVNIGTPLLALVDIDRLRLETLFSEQDIPRVSVGAPATLTVSGAPGRVFDGRISAIGPQTDSETKQFPVEIEVQNPPDRPLKGGMVARVEIVYETFDDVPLLPVDGLVEDGDTYAFYVVENGIARRRTLELGPRQGQMVGVLAGAAAGDTVVVLGQARLVDGSPVHIEEIR